MSADPKKLREHRSRMNERILEEDYLPIKRFFNLDAAAYRGESLDSRTKHLMGLAVSAALRCNECIAYHIEEAAREGASRSEIVETLNIALIIGGSIVIPHLRFAFEILDEAAPKD